MDEETNQQISIEEIKSTEYKKAVNFYRPLFKEEEKHAHFKISPESEKRLSEVYSGHREQLVDFSTRVTALIPEEVFSQLEYFPHGAMKIKALLSLAYTKDEQAHHKIGVREMYIRALSALSNDNYTFNNNSEGKTEEVIDRFLEGDWNRDSFGNNLLSLVHATMPVVSPYEERREKEGREFDQFMTLYRQKLTLACQQYREYYLKLYPDQEEELVYFGDDLPFVYQIGRLRTFTNDEVMLSESGYHSLSAGAIAFGVDQESGLPLAVYQLPGNYNHKTEDPDSNPHEDAIYTQTQVFIHESVHNAGEIKHTGDWLSLINEMITDSTSYILVLKSKGLNFAEVDTKYLMEGYTYLTWFAQDIVANGLLSSEEMVNIGLRQDPQKFLQLFGERIKVFQDPEKIKKIYLSAMRRGLILPRKEKDWEKYLQQFKKDPDGIFKKECMEMWKTIGSSYLGMRFYYSGILGEMRERHPEIGEDNFKAIRTPPYGVLNDEAVDIFYELFSEAKVKEKHEPYPFFLAKEKLIDRIKTSNIDYGKWEVPDRFKIGSEDEETIKIVMLFADEILYQGLSTEAKTYDWSDEQKFQTIVDFTQSIYEEIYSVLEKNWQSKGINVSQEDVLIMITEVVPTWFSLGGQRQEDSVDLLIETIKQKTDIITSPIVTEEGKEYIPTPNQVYYWGKALD